VTDPERVPIDHDLSPALREAVAADTGALAAVYNDIQETPQEAFDERFGASLSALREAVAGVDAPLVVFVLGLTLDDDPTTRELVVGATLLTGHVPDAEGAVAELVYRDGDAPTPDDVLALPVRPEDCPPGSGRAAADLDAETYYEVVASMAYQRFDLFQNDLDRYASSYLRPLVRGLEAFDEARE